MLQRHMVSLKWGPQLRLIFGFDMFFLALDMALATAILRAPDVAGLLSI